VRAAGARRVWSAAARRARSARGRQAPPRPARAPEPRAPGRGLGGGQKEGQLDGINPSDPDPAGLRKGHLLAPGQAVRIWRYCAS
jgi:hypothetical protein